MSTCSDEVQPPPYFGLAGEKGREKQIKPHEISIRRLDAQSDDEWDMDVDDRAGETTQKVAQAPRFEMDEAITMSQSTAATEHEDVMLEDRQVEEDQDEDPMADDGDEVQIEEESAEEDESSDDEPIDATVQKDMHNLQQAFPGFKKKYRLIKRIGEGMPNSLLFNLKVHCSH